MSAGCSRTPLWKKLGLHTGERLLLIDAPPGWSVPDLPDGVSTSSASSSIPAREGAGADVIVNFSRTRTELAAALPRLAPQIFPGGAIWAAWPRRAGGYESDIRDQDVRAIALPLGLVDVKVAAIDEDWSGLRLVWRRELRGAPSS